MVRHIDVPVGNSEYSNRAIDVAVQLARAFGARLTGCHVYAARPALDRPCPGGWSVAPQSRGG